MRVARAVQSGRGQEPLFLYGPNNIFVRKLASNAALNSDQSPALKLANQLNYANPNYSYNGATAPSFYGYSGMGYGGISLSLATLVIYQYYTIPVYVVDSTVPNQTVTYIQSNGSPEPPGAATNLQSYFNAVPVPDVTKIPQGRIQAAGTDGHAVFWRPSTNELWEMWRFSGSPGAYTFEYGGYTSSANTFNGIYPNFWGARATSLAAAGGLITIQDIVDVLNGLPIRHALLVAPPVTAATSYSAPVVPVPPATRNDSGSNTTQYQADGITPNPAYGTVDAVGEGTWCRFPASFNPATAMPSSGPIALAIATAIRDYGLFVGDKAGNCIFCLEDARVLGSPYSWAKVNPFARHTSSVGSYYNSYINNNVPTSWTDSTLPKIAEIMDNRNGVVSKIPWQNLQMLEPFSS